MKYFPVSFPLDNDNAMLLVKALEVIASIQSVPPGVTVAFFSPSPQRVIGLYDLTLLYLTIDEGTVNVPSPY